MSALILSTENIILLSKLELSVRREYGCRFNLSEHASLFALLKLATESSNLAIKLAYIQFYESLPIEEKNKLIFRGIASEEKKPDTEQSGQIYRGIKTNPIPQPTKIDETPDATTASEELISTEPLNNPNTRLLPEGVAKITYRGNVVYKKDGHIIANTLDQLLEKTENDTENDTEGKTKRVKRVAESDSNNKARK